MMSKKAWLIGSLLFILVQTVGCATVQNNYGKLNTDSDVTQAIERYEVDPTLNYYISGPSSTPNAIMGLDKTYTLQSDLWKKIDMTPAIMKDLVYNMDWRASRVSLLLHGFAILDEKGQKIGIWYSVIDSRTYIKMVGEKTVIINTPPQGAYNGNDDRDRNNRFP